MCDPVTYTNKSQDSSVSNKTTTDHSIPTQTTPDNSPRYSSLPNMVPISTKPKHTHLSFSPNSRRRRLCNVNRRQLDALGTSPPIFIARIPRDPFQPQSGSISDVHNEAEDDEEADLFPTNMPFRPRAHTSPEDRMWLRKVKLRNRNRPLTPPPADLNYTELEQELSTRDLPCSIPEDPMDLKGTDMKDSTAINYTALEDDIFMMDY